MAGGRQEKLKLIFQHFDNNGDGRLDRAEMAALIQAMNPRAGLTREQTEATVAEMFRAYADFLGVDDPSITLDVLRRSCGDGTAELDRDFETLGLSRDVDGDAPHSRAAADATALGISPASSLPQPPDLLQPIQEEEGTVGEGSDGLMDGDVASPRPPASWGPQYSISSSLASSSFRSETDYSDLGDYEGPHLGMEIEEMASFRWLSPSFRRRPQRIRRPELSEVDWQQLIPPGFWIGSNSSACVPKAMVREQVAAGWPEWLAVVAAEAIKGWVPRRADSFEKLDKIGQGTCSNVYRARDLDNGKIVALKKVRFDNMEPESVRFMAREIHILRRLDHPNIIKLEGLVTSRMSYSLYLVFEYMEHDLAGLASFPGLKFTEPQIKCYMQQLLRGLDHCHSHSILHRDIKGSNLLFDNTGTLKIADFGSASFFDPEQRHPLTSRVVTLWYRPPELLLGATHYGVAVDLWSTGCILAELYAGKPIMPGRTEVEQLHKIFKLCGSPSEDSWRKSKLPHATIFKPQQPYRRCVLDTFKDIPASALALMDVLLSIDPADRGTAASALKSEDVAKMFTEIDLEIWRHPTTTHAGPSLRYHVQRLAHAVAMQPGGFGSHAVMQQGGRGSHVAMQHGGCGSHETSCAVYSIISSIIASRSFTASIHNGHLFHQELWKRRRRKWGLR